MADGAGQKVGAAPASVQLPDHLIEVLDKLPPAKREEITLIVSQAIGSFSGPFPPPWMLDDYERHHPGFLSELMKRAAAAQSEREDIDRTIVSAQIKYMAKGQWMMFILGLSTLAVAALAIVYGMQIAAVSFGLASLAALAASFLRNPFAGQPQQPPPRTTPPPKPKQRKKG